MRDKIPIRIHAHGEEVDVVEVHGDDLLDVLKAKLVEEGLEVFWARETKNVLAEMADAFEVLLALARVLGLTLHDVQREAKKKRRAAGAFRRGLVLVETQDTPLIRVEEGRPKRRRHRTTRGARHPTAAVRQARLDGDELVIPLVPPLPSEAHGPTVLRLRAPWTSLSVSYGEKGVRISSGEAPVAPPEEQLELFSGGRTITSHPQRGIE